MTFDEFYRLALTIDDYVWVDNDADGFLTIHTNYYMVGDNEVPLGYKEVE